MRNDNFDKNYREEIIESASRFLEGCPIDTGESFMPVPMHQMLVENEPLGDLFSDQVDSFAKVLIPEPTSLSSLSKEARKVLFTIIVAWEIERIFPNLREILENFQESLRKNEDPKRSFISMGEWMDKMGDTPKIPLLDLQGWIEFWNKKPGTLEIEPSGPGL